MRPENSFLKIRTDLACERRRADPSTPGTNYREYTQSGFTVTALTVTSEEGAREIGKPEGTYLTVTFPPLFEMDETQTEEGAAVIAGYLTALLPPRDSRPILIVGLGNATLTADAVGPLTARQIPATAHCEEGGLLVLTPGVTWQSGTEAASLVHGVVKELDAAAVIAIDALCARSTERLACTVQLADTGITPGSGIRLPRSAIDRETMGVPVIAVGVPTVVSSAALVCEALERAGADEFPPEFLSLVEEDCLYVSPKEIDEGVTNAARLIARSIRLLA